MSKLLIDNVTNILNGTRIDCSFSEGKSTTVIDVIRNGTSTCMGILHDNNNIVLSELLQESGPLGIFDHQSGWIAFSM